MFTAESRFDCNCTTQIQAGGYILESLTCDVGVVAVGGDGFAVAEAAICD